MKVLIPFIFLFGLSNVSFAKDLSHQCFVIQSVQAFNTETGQSTFSKGQTQKYPVTKSEHEDPYEVQIVSEAGSDMGKAKVDTGTLLGTPEGDLIQAHAYVEVFGNEEYFGLVASTESPMARSHRFFTAESDKEMTMVNIDLQCEIKK